MYPRVLSTQGTPFRQNSFLLSPPELVFPRDPHPAMGDPFSTVASAAGIISLGLQVSGGLIKFCKDYSSLEQDLHRLREHTELLEQIVRIIETQQQQTQQHQTPASAEQITKSLRACSNACSTCISDVSSIVKKYEQRPASLKGRSENFTRRLRYPFDKDQFEDLRSRLNQFSGALTTRLQLLNLFVLP